MRWSIGYFGVKDLFTIINVLGGVGGIYFALRGEPRLAAFAVFAGYIFGDALDGPVARATKTGNKFGGEFDSAADHLGQGIAPAVVAYAAFAKGGYEYLGAAVMGFLCVTASIRMARFNVNDFNYPLCYCGLPRTISGLVALSLPNATLFFEDTFLGYPGAAAILFLVGALNLAPIPYMTHKGRSMQGYVKILVLMWLLILPAAAFVFARDFFFDVIFVTSFGYALTAWIPIQPDERRDFWAEYKRWSKAVASAK